MSGSHSPLSTPTPNSLALMHSLPTTTSTPVSNTSDGSSTKYNPSSNSPSFASVVSSSAIPVSPSHSASLASQHNNRQNLYQQKHEQTCTSSPALLSNYNSIKNTATSSVTSSQSNRSPAHSSSSKYDSALASPTSRSFSANQSSNGSAAPDQSGSDSSDVEIYLNKLVFNDPVSRMHDATSSNSTHLQPPQAQTRSQLMNELSLSSLGSRNSAHDHQQSVVGGDSALPCPTSQTPGANPKFGLGVSDSKDPNDTKSTNANIGSTLSPLPLSLPLSSSPSQLKSHSQRNGNGIPQAKSPQNPPPAPVHATIPLPDVDERDYNLNERASHAERRQFQQQCQPLHGHRHGNVHELGYGLVQGDIIDLAGLNPPQQQTLRMSPPSQSQPLSSPSEFGITPSSTTSSGFDVSSSTSTAATTPALGSAVSGLCASDSNPDSIEDAGTDSALSLLDSNKTPNVYINGLPPHFPEDQLFALASPFGEIRSVRTFTRHVRDSESGYGFVLFETIEAAERCIISLRRYRNLHPTFSKQIHKIPGTTYAQVNLAPSGSSTTSWDEQGEFAGCSLGDGSTAGDASFKAKMESLHDPTSTNLYMEGLPLSIDEPTLAALVSPHRISSSRFFQTRLSHPPRIIAFVRLETRTGAEEVIERLHGRMVRGWNDTGSRISVRFADTSEQRELRLLHQRAERSTDEGDGSPARMTIAQAALLNLRGQELRPPKAGPVIHAQPTGVRVARSARGLGNSVSMPDFSSNAHLDTSSGVGSGSGSNGLEVDYSLAPGRNLSAGSGIGHGRGPSPGIHPYQTQPSSNWSAHGLNQGHGHGKSPMDPAMIALLDSLRGNGVPYKAGDSDYMQNQRSVKVGHHLRPPSHSLQHHNHHGASRSLVDVSYSRPAPAYTRSGYTATEEYIMRTHADSAALAQAQAHVQYEQQQQQQAAERRRPAPLDLRRRQRGDEGQDESGTANIGVGLRGYRTQASIGRVGQEIISPPITSSSSSQSMMNGLSSTMSEEDFHASAAAVRNEFRQQLQSLAGNVGGDRDGEGGRMAQNSSSTRHNPYIHPVHVNSRLSRESSGQYQQQQQSTHQQPPQQQVQRPLALSPLLASSSNNDSPNPSDLVNYQHATTHMRSTTLPQHRSSSVRDSQQQIHRARGHYQHSSMSIPAQTLRTPQHASVSVMNGNSGIDAGGYGGEHQQSPQQPRSQDANQQNSSHGMDAGNTWTSNNNHSQPNPLSRGTKSHYSSPNLYNSDDPSSSSPSLISPTLTYSSQTPSTLSPATPFFGSFNNQAEGFEKNSHGVNVHGLDQQQKNGASATRSGS